MQRRKEPDQEILQPPQQTLQLRHPCSKQSPLNVGQIQACRRLFQKQPIRIQRKENLGQTWMQGRLRHLLSTKEQDARYITEKLKKEKRDLKNYR